MSLQGFLKKASGQRCTKNKMMETASWVNPSNTPQAVANDWNSCTTGSTPTIHIAGASYLLTPGLSVSLDRLNARILGGFYAFGRGKIKKKTIENI
jgi:hypothetical protein